MDPGSGCLDDTIAAEDVCCLQNTNGSEYSEPSFLVKGKKKKDMKGKLILSWSLKIIS